ncbi:hypothetical protein LCGC14_1688590 [marine sediment metagenome]|uniref:Uncharacterized protein n=1 Tax=marine sediment metagenome TaxID=412755 RepID=A0A0F9I917_9ZZZZ
MNFNVDCVRNCLESNGVVFTVRSYFYNSENSEFNDRKIKRFFIKEINKKEDLIDFVKLSGFGNVEEWWNKIEMFCKFKKKYLYLASFSH